MKKKCLLPMIVALFATSCGCAGGSTTINSPFGHEMDFSQGYNKNIWYKNDLDQRCADPNIVYCEVDGYYYMYMTTDALGCAGFNVYRSKQLNHWEELNPCFLPDPYSWGTTSLWAPNVIKIGSKYYLYYSARNNTTGTKGISVAVADHPAGPFHEYEGEDYYGNIITRNDQVFKLGYPAIDAAPFLDDDGQLYLYFAKDQVNAESNCMGVKLLDPVTPDLSTLKTLTVPGKVKPDAVEMSINWERQSGGGKWNEAPFMLRVGNKYYLTYSANYFSHVAYAVGYAVSDSPLGTFVKPNSYENENLLLGVEPDEQRTLWDFMSGSGHHCFFYAGDELMIGYHAHIDRVYGSSIRAFALDKVIVENGKMFANGPTYSLQPLPTSVSGYKNVAKEASITTDSTNDKNLLVDDKIPMHIFRQEHIDLQAKYTKGHHNIVVEFNNPVKATAIALYNSINYETRLAKIDRITIEDFASDVDIKMNPEYMDNYFEEYSTGYLRPGCPFICEFNEREVKKITIEMNSDIDFALSELVVLGR